MQTRQCQRCKRTKELHTDNFRFTRGFFQHICRHCEAVVSRARYRKKRACGLVLRREPIVRRDITRLVRKYNIIYKYLASIGVSPVETLAGNVDIVLNKRRCSCLT